MGLCLVAACSPRAASPGVPKTPVAARAPAGPARPAPLPPPTEEERALAERLRATVSHLALEVGERHAAEGWNLATATDDIARTLEKMGYEVRRQGLVAGQDVVVQNVEVHVSGGEHGGQTLVVGAHFDTSAGTPGADSDASGVAAVLELARAFRERKLERTVRFAFFTNEEAPHFQTDHMGSLVYAKDLATQGLDVVGMMSIDGIGAYSVEPGSARFPAELAPHYPTTGDFLAVVGNEPSRALLEEVTASMKKHATLPIVGSVLGADTPFAASSDQWAFWKVGMPAIMITDTGPFRYAHYHQKTDLPEHLDFDRMARVVLGLEQTLAELAEK